MNSNFFIIDTTSRVGHRLSMKSIPRCLVPRRLSLIRAKESGEGENGETSLDPLCFVASHTRVTLACLCAKNEGPEEEAGPQNSLGFWIPRSGFRISGTLSVEHGFRISVVRGIPDSLSCNPDGKAQDSGLHKQEFPGFWIP